MLIPFSFEEAYLGPTLFRYIKLFSSHLLSIKSKCLFMNLLYYTILHYTWFMPIHSIDSKLIRFFPLDEPGICTRLNQ